MTRERNKIYPSIREAKRLKRQVKIFVTENMPERSHNRYCWAWEESADKKVFGSANTIDEIKRRSSNMFPDSEIILLFR